MKMRWIIVFCFCAVAFPLFGQQPCADYDRLIKEAIIETQKRNYAVAIRKYNAARVCNPGERAFIDEQIIEVFNLIEQQRKDADAAKIAAQASEKKAQENLRIAEEQREIAEETLIQLQLAKADTVDLLIEQTNQHILLLEYDQAISKTIVAKKLKEKEEEVLKLLQELSFFFVETGQFLKADSLLQVIDIAIPSRDLISYKHAISNINSDHFSLLEKRYYPEMILVPGIETIDSFFIAATETTVWQYYVYAISSQTDIVTPNWQLTGHDPITNVSLIDAISYTNWLNQRQHKAVVYQYNNPKDTTPLFKQILEGNAVLEINDQADGIRLPTVAEWEYAAAGGPFRADDFLFSGSDTLDTHGWYRNNANNRTQNVTGKLPNQLGIYGMSGNVREWCVDFTASDLTLKLSENTFILKGGNWEFGRYGCRIWNRTSKNYHHKSIRDGFRSARKL